MNTLFFRYAVEVEKARSITQAAENLYMAQPNLSKAIRELEETLGFAVFKRTSRGVFPTPKGGEFLAIAKNVLAQLDQMEALANPAAALDFSLSIPRGSYIAEAVARFVSGLDFTQEIGVRLLETDAMQTLHHVAEGRFALGVIRYESVYENYFLDYAKEKKLRTEPVWEFVNVALLSRAHPLADAKPLRLTELVDSVEIVAGDSDVPYLHTAKAMPKRRVTVYSRCNMFELLHAIPNAYLWSAPVPDNLLERYELVQRRCPDAPRTSKDAIVAPQQHAFTEYEQLFMQKLREVRDELSAQNYD